MKRGIRNKRHLISRTENSREEMAAVNQSNRGRERGERDACAHTQGRHTCYPPLTPAPGSVLQEALPNLSRQSWHTSPVLPASPHIHRSLLTCMQLFTCLSASLACSFLGSRGLGSLYQCLIQSRFSVKKCFILINYFFHEMKVNNKSRKVKYRVK